MPGCGNPRRGDLGGGDLYGGLPHRAARGDYNPHKRKHWKVTADYDQEEKALYVTCWLKHGSTFNSFGDMELPLGEYGEIDKVVLTGGWPWGGEKVVWQGESGGKS